MIQLSIFGPFFVHFDLPPYVVYGVTFYGAQQQIRNRIEEKFISTFDDAYLASEVQNKIVRSGYYLAKVVMEAMGQVFTGGKAIMKWLGDCAGKMAKKQEPISWITPLGLPIIQPYRSEKSHTVITQNHSLLLTTTNDALPLSVRKQQSAFPPNFVHSLDSSHMLMTALRMKERGITFAAVHDSYWCFPSDVNVMNEELRKAFIELHSKDVLEEFLHSLKIRYPKLRFKDIPEKGNFDLNKVADSQYFFS